MQADQRNVWLMGTWVVVVLSGCSSPEATSVAASGGAPMMTSAATSPAAAGGINANTLAATGGQPVGAGGAISTTAPPPAGAGTVRCQLPAVGSPRVAVPSGDVAKLTVIDWAGFKGAATYTFDDANSSQIDHYAELNALGVPFTFYLSTGKSSAKNPIWAQALKDGHELGNHGRAHLQTGTADDVAAASTFIEQQFGVRPSTFAAPYGDASYVPIAEQSFLVNRGVSNAIIKPNGTAKPFNLPCFIPDEGASASVFNAQIDQAVSAGGWRIVLVHGFTGGTDSAYLPINLADFVESVNYTKSLGNVWVGTMVDIAAYWRGQIAVSNAIESVSDTGTTYTWSLPANFPPGKCLRVVAGGGKISQGGSAIAWNERGYYEISLDVGSLTVSP